MLAPRPAWPLVGALACGSAPDGPDPVTPAPADPVTPGPADPAAPDPADPADPAPRIFRTCPIRQPTPRPWRLDAVAPLDSAAERSWLVADHDDKPVLLHLGPTGDLTTTSLPAWTEDSAHEPAALRLAATAAPPTWWTIDLRDPDRPTLGARTPLDPAVAGDYPKALASDATRALLAQYRAAPDPGPRRYIGSTYFLDVATGRPLAAPAPMTVWLAHCARGRCHGYATDNATDHAVIAGFDDTGHRTLLDLGAQACAGAGAWRQGRHWFLVWSDRGAFGVASVDTATGEAHSARIVAGPPDQCTLVQPLRVADHHGVLLGSDSRRSFLESRGDRTFGPPEPLPPLTHNQLALAPFGDGVLLAQYAARAGMVHGPEDPRGVREYHKVWSFTGSHDFLRRDRDTWQLEPGGPLPHDGAQGQHADGYGVHLLTRPGHAGVLVAGGRGLAGAYLPLRSECP